ncbi:phage baseplate protein [Klebsiella aerogenes]
MDILSTLFQQQSRRLGPSTNLIVPSVVISEKHSDTLEITEHPVEVGAAISDHAYKRPSEVVMEVGFAGGGSLLDFADTSSLGLTLGLSPREVYENLIALQNSRVPFDVVTGKRIYHNMLIRAIEVTTDRTTENVLSAVLTLREVIITSTTTTQVAAKSDMKDGVNTSAVQNSGVKTPKPVNESLLSNFMNYGKSFLNIGG